MPKKYYNEQDGVTQAIDLRDIDPSPSQHRKNFDWDKNMVQWVRIRLIG